MEQNRSTIPSELGDDSRTAWLEADETTRRAVRGYLATYAGPWGLKASEEDAVLGIIDAVWPTWAAGERSAGIYKFRADARLGEIADYLFEDSGETEPVALIAEIVARLRPILEEQA